MLVSYARKPHYLKIFINSIILLDEKQELPLGKVALSDFAVRGLVGAAVQGQAA